MTIRVFIRMAPAARTNLKRRIVISFCTGCEVYRGVVVLRTTQRFKQQLCRVGPDPDCTGRPQFHGYTLNSLAMTTSFPAITHVIYDMDGLLLDTEPFYTEATQAIVGRYGHTFDWSLKSRMIGKAARDSARILVDALQLPITPEDYLREREATLAALFPGAQAMR